MGVKSEKMGGKAFFYKNGPRKGPGFFFGFLPMGWPRPRERGFLCRVGWGKNAPKVELERRFLATVAVSALEGGKNGNNRGKAAVLRKAAPEGAEKFL